MAGRKQVTENLLLFLEGAAIDLEGRMDAVTDVLATLIDGDAGRYDRCLDRLWERLQPRHADRHAQAGADRSPAPMTRAR